jgi:hypothetical protein
MAAMLSRSFTPPVPGEPQDVTRLLHGKTEAEYGAINDQIRAGLIRVAWTGAYGYPTPLLFDEVVRVDWFSPPNVIDTGNPSWFMIADLDNRAGGAPDGLINGGPFPHVYTPGAGLLIYDFKSFVKRTNEDPAKAFCKTGSKWDFLCGVVAEIGPTGARVIWQNYASAVGEGAAMYVQQMPRPAKVLSATAGPFALTNNDTLTMKVDRLLATRTVTFVTADFVNIAAATAAEVAAKITSAGAAFNVDAVVVDGRVVLRTLRPGADAFLEVTGGAANTPLAFSTSEVQGVNGHERGSPDPSLELLWDSTLSVVGHNTVIGSGGNQTFDDPIDLTIVGEGSTARLRTMLAGFDVPLVGGFDAGLTDTTLLQVAGPIAGLTAKARPGDLVGRRFHAPGTVIGAPGIVHVQGSYGMKRA